MYHRRESEKPKYHIVQVQLGRKLVFLCGRRQLIDGASRPPLHVGLLISPWFVIRSAYRESREEGEGSENGWRQLAIRTPHEPQEPNVKISAVPRVADVGEGEHGLKELQVIVPLRLNATTVPTVTSRIM